MSASPPALAPVMTLEAMRAYNALKRAGILKVGQLLLMLHKDEIELLKQFPTGGAAK